MKTILCYGDSNTYGYIPATGGRYDHKTRWPMALERILNQNCAGEPEWWVDEEGLNGRTSSFDDPVELDRNGLRQIIPILKSHKPLDAAVVMLGTNDLKRRFNPSPFDISQGVLNVVKAIQYSETGPRNTAPKVLVICPPPLLESPVFGDIFSGAPAISKLLPPYYKQICEESGASFFDAGTVAKTSPADGVHLEPSEHLRLAEAVAKIIRVMAAD
ncbi:MAG: SGNH/GDSL hydrolase family protein [Spirochaetaceae bacterium]|jgi:lysophospholipase L1-like esterase|nr:SGNH/GDSL hydrolase family protein [Spirochaetaceae bacterium]